MIRKLGYCAGLVLLIAVISLPASAASQKRQEKSHSVFSSENLIAVSEKMVFLESSTADPGKLFDEQDKVSIAPDGKITGACTNEWKATGHGYNTNGKMPHMAYVDLGKEYEVNASAVYHKNKETKMTLSYGKPGEWEPFASYDVQGGGHWAPQENEAVKTRYIGIQFDIHAGTLNTGELLLFGKATGEKGEKYTAAKKIKITRDMVTNVTGHVDKGTEYDGEPSSPYRWFDEQDKLSDMPVETPKTYFSFGWQLYREPSVADIDLRRSYDIEKIALYDGEGSGDFKIFAGSYGNWEEVFNYTMSVTDAWVYVDLRELRGTINTRYLRIEKAHPTNKPVNKLYEIAIYGNPTSEAVKPDPLPEEKPVAPLTMQKLMGYNSFAWYNSPEYVGSGGNIRQYLMPNTLYGKDTGDKIGFTEHELDSYYQRHAQAGINITVCLQQSLPHITENLQMKPVEAGSSTTDPLSYKAHAEMMFQYAARYGNSPVSPSLLKLKDGQEAKTGLGYLHYYENWNEPDANWRPAEKGVFSAEEYAAMCSADYDGHEGAMGTGYGLKNADPDAKLVMSGITACYTDYVDAMAYWFRNNRSDQKFLPDVINLHHYDGQKAPETTGSYDLWKKTIDYFRTNYPGKEIWLSEFGWDTYIAENGEKSVTAAPSTKAQAQWLARSYLLGSAAGFDQMQMYMIGDDNEGSLTKHATSGVVKRTDKEKDYYRPSWYYINTMRETLGDAVFQEVVQMDKVYILRYRNAQTKEDIYAVWSPTENDTKIQDYQVNIAGGKSAFVTNLKDRSGTGNRKDLAIQNGTVKIDVSETPAFITVSNQKGTIRSPQADIEAGDYNGKQIVALSAEDGADIYYTTDYSVPTADSQKYTEPVLISETSTIRAVAVKNGKTSPTENFAYWIKPIYLDNLKIAGAKLTPDFNKNTLEYWTSVSKDTKNITLTLSAPDHISTEINGKKAGKEIELSVQEGVNHFRIRIFVPKTGEEKMYHLYVNRPHSQTIQIIRPAGADSAQGAERFGIGGAFDGAPALDPVYGKVDGNGGPNSLKGNIGGIGYIDFGENWKNIRITSSWTQYMAYTSTDSLPLSTMWWSMENHGGNTSGLDESVLKLASAANVDTKVDKWYLDKSYTGKPVQPKARYLMIQLKEGEALRVREFAFAGYEAAEEEAKQPPSETTVDIIKPVSAGTINEKDYTNFEAAFDGNVTYDTKNKTPVLTNAGITPYFYAGRSVYLDLGENWKNIRITSTWTYYQAWSVPAGALSTMRWSSEKSSSTDSIPENRLRFHNASGNLGKTACWREDGDYSDNPIIPKNRYLIIDIQEGFVSRTDELAILGYTV